MTKTLTTFALVTAVGLGTATMAEEDMGHDDSIDPIILNSMSYEGIIMGQPRDEIVAMVSESMVSNEAFFAAQESGEPLIVPSVLDGDIPVAQIKYTLPHNGEEVIENFDRLDALWNRQDETWGAAQRAFQAAHEEFQTMACTPVEINWYNNSFFGQATEDQTDFEEGQVITLEDICPPALVS